MKGGLRQGLQTTKLPRIRENAHRLFRSADLVAALTT